VRGMVDPNWVRNVFSNYSIFSVYTHILMSRCIAKSDVCKKVNKK
jgi:hypothetical protein